MTDEEMLEAVEAYVEVRADVAIESSAGRTARSELLEKLVAWSWGKAHRRRAERALLDAQSTVCKAYLALRESRELGHNLRHDLAKLDVAVGELRKLEENTP